jgi:hypothetical protein
MDNPKHVLVLGAGASVDYGLPTGHSLVNMLHKEPKLVTPSENAKLNLESMRSNREGTLKNFANALKRSGLRSIDTFLEERKEFRDVGKTQIARILAPLEKQAVESAACQAAWHGWFIHNVLKHTETPADLPLRVITFNYDCLFEWSLILAISNRYDISVSDARQKVIDFDVLHMYGRLPTWNSWDADSDERSVSLDIGDSVLYEARNTIQVVAEDRNENQDWNKARDWIRDSKSVVFLGFGFDAVNNQRLGITPDGKWRVRSDMRFKHVVATGYNLLGQEQMNITSRICRASGEPYGPKHLYGGGINLGSEKQGCEEVLRRFIDPVVHKWVPPITHDQCH